MEKVFVGKVEVKEGKYGEFTTISFGPADLEKLKEYSSVKWFVNLTMKNSKKWWKYLEVYIPEKKESTWIKISDIPFN